MAENYRRRPHLSPRARPGVPLLPRPPNLKLDVPTDRTPAQAGVQSQPDRSVAHVTLDPRLRGDVALHSVRIVIPAQAGIHRRNIGASIPNASANSPPASAGVTMAENYRRRPHPSPRA